MPSSSRDRPEGQFNLHSQSRLHAASLNLTILRYAGQRHAVNHHLQQQVSLGHVAHLTEVERVARDGFEEGLALFDGNRSPPARMIIVPCLVWFLEL